MKKRLYLLNIFALALAITFFTACESKLINPLPESVLTDANAFNTVEGINQGVLGVYNVLQSKANTNYEMMDMPSGDMYGELFSLVPGINQIALLSVDPENPRINTFWIDCYKGIVRANTVLENIDNTDEYKDSEKEQFIGEAKYLRASFYFDLVRIFGGVPLFTENLSIEEAENVERSSEEEVYKQIITDMKEAVDLLPAPSQIEWGRASKGAALALISKVYVYMEDWESADSYLSELFSDEFSYSLVSNFGDLFEIATEVNSEVILAVPSVAGSNGSILATRFAPHQGIAGVVQNGQGDNFGWPAWNLRKGYEEGDSRLEATITETFKPYVSDPADPPLWRPYVSKFIVPSDGSDSGLDIPVLRLADMILLYAEVLYNLGEPELALKELNKVRARAFKSSSHNYTLSDIGTKEQFYDKLLLERQLELAAENNRWFDLVRTGRFVDELGDGVYGPYSSADGDGLVRIPIKAESYNKVFPIPVEQIRLANPGVLDQNEGY